MTLEGLPHWSSETRVTWWYSLRSESQEKGVLGYCDGEVQHAQLH
jgi:hypothetical protein